MLLERYRPVLPTAIPLRPVLGSNPPRQVASQAG